MAGFGSKGFNLDMEGGTSVDPMLAENVVYKNETGVMIGTIELDANDPIEMSDLDFYIVDPWIGDFVTVTALTSGAETVGQALDIIQVAARDQAPSIAAQLTAAVVDGYAKIQLPAIEGTYDPTIDINAPELGLVGYTSGKRRTAKNEFDHYETEVVGTDAVSPKYVAAEAFQAILEPMHTWFRVPMRGGFTNMVRIDADDTWTTAEIAADNLTSIFDAAGSDATVEADADGKLAMSIYQPGPFLLEPVTYDALTLRLGFTVDSIYTNGQPPYGVIPKLQQMAGTEAGSKSVLAAEAGFVEIATDKTFNVNGGPDIVLPGGADNIYDIIAAAQQVLGKDYTFTLPLSAGTYIPTIEWNYKGPLPIRVSGPDAEELFGTEPVFTEGTAGDNVQEAISYLTKAAVQPVTGPVSARVVGGKPVGAVFDFTRSGADDGTLGFTINGEDEDGAWSPQGVVIDMTILSAAYITPMNVTLPQIAAILHHSLVAFGKVNIFESNGRLVIETKKKGPLSKLQISDFSTNLGASYDLLLPTDEFQGSDGLTQTELNDRIVETF